MNLSELQDAIGGLLEGDAGVTAVLGSHDARILGGPDPDAVFPYLTIGEDQARDTSVQFLTANDVFLTVHVWTKEDGFASCKAIAGAVADLLDDEDGFAVSASVRCCACFHRSSRFMRDPRAGVRHGVIEFEAQIETATSG